MNDLFLRACRREQVDHTPIWLMRQAGRYLPEYRDLRNKYDMLTMCRTPELAVQVTLQPLKRFDLDAAILFSDIMIPLKGMGVDFNIQESVGPVVANPVRNESGANALHVVVPQRDVPFVLESIHILRQELSSRVPLIGFAGAPFTLASYVIEGKPSRDLLRTKNLMYTDPTAWHVLMDKLTQSIGAYLVAQVKSGAQAVQMFDSWVGALSPADYARHVLPYSKRIFEMLGPSGVPVIHFGTGTASLLELLQQAGGSVIGMDWRVPMDSALCRLPNAAVQGNLDPAVMLTTKDIIKDQACRILEEVGGRPGHIFNLGHGILPTTPLDNVAYLIDLVHNAQSTS